MNRMLLNEVLATSHTARDAELANSELVSLYVVPDSPLSIVVGGVQLPTRYTAIFHSDTVRVLESLCFWQTGFNLGLASGRLVGPRR